MAEIAPDPPASIRVIASGGLPSPQSITATCGSTTPAPWNVVRIVSAAPTATTAGAIGATAGGPRLEPGSLTVEPATPAGLTRRIVSSAGPGAAPEMSRVTVVTPATAEVVAPDPKAAGRPAVTFSNVSRSAPIVGTRDRPRASTKPTSKAGRIAEPSLVGKPRSSY